MAFLELFGLGLPLIYATGQGPIEYRLMYAAPTEFGIKNADGSETFAHGTGFVWDSASQSFTGGTVEELRHFGKNGDFAGALYDIDRPVAEIVQALENGFPKSSVLSGDDTFDARTRADGAKVNDRLESGTGHDTVYGGSGNDRLIGDVHVAVAGNDHLIGGRGDDIMYGAGGADAIYGNRGTDTAVFPAAFKDLTIATNSAGGYTVTTRFGQTLIKGIERIGADDGIFERKSGGGWRKISSYPGVAKAMPWSVKTGTAGNNTLRFDGFAGEANWAHGVGLGGDGDDYLLYWGFDNDGLLLGGDGEDFIEIHTGWTGKVRAYGGNGNDHLAIYYNGGHSLNGGPGNDLIEPGFGDDLLTGGSGGDEFRFPVRVSEEAETLGDEISFGDDVITDFVIGSDSIGLPSQVLNRASLAQTPDGLLLTVTLVNGATPIGTATILLKGLQAPEAELADLLAD
jgi:RTX calcium-binding nonapeptide repeat (4 copies)